MSDFSTAPVGIVLPRAGTPTLFRRALESIRNQSLGEWKLVITEAEGATDDMRRVAALVMGNDDPRTADYRRRLTAQLY